MTGPRTSARQGRRAGAGAAALMLAAALLAGCEVMDGSVDDADESYDDSFATVSVDLVPVADVAKDNAVGVGDLAALYRNVNDGTASADDTDYVKGAPGVVWTSHTVKYGGAPAGSVSDVVVHYRAFKGGAAGTAQVELYDGTTRIGVGALRTVGSIADYSDTFTGLSVSSADNLRTKMIFHNTSGVWGLRYTRIWLSVTTASASPAWHAAPLYGGGYNTVIKYNPIDPSSVLLGTDIGGLHISNDGGVNWSTRGRGGIAPKGSQIASVAWHPTVVDVAYALVGECTAGNGGLLLSTDRGWTWRLASSLPVGCGNHASKPLATDLPDPHPRQIGTLITVDPAGYIYVGSARDGLMRASLSSSGVPGTFSVVAMAPSGGRYHYIRSIALDDLDPTVLYVATHTASTALATGRPWVVRNARTTADESEMSGGPRDVEELASLDGNLYGVSNDPGGAGGGLYRLASARTQAVGSAWRHVQGPRYDVGVVWYSLAAQRRAGITSIWLSTYGTWRPSSTVAWKFLWRGKSSDGFATDGTWQALPDAIGDTPNDVAGPSVVATPDRWWKLDTSTYAWPGKDSHYMAGDFALHPTLDGHLMFAATGSPWITSNDGKTWYPMPNGVNLLSHFRMLADPNQAGRAVVGNVDYGAFFSTDAFESGLMTLPPSGTAHDGWSLAFDTGTTPSAFYIGVGIRDSDGGGQIFMSQTPETGPWTTVMTTSQAGLGHRPMGLAVIRNPSAPSQPIVLAAIQGSTMWRKVGSGSWQAATGLSFAGTVGGTEWPRPVTFAWKPGSSKVYVYERTVGLYRSDDFGASWKRLLPSPNSSAGQGFLSLDPTDPNRVYLATSSWVKLITNAGTAGVDGAVGSNLNLPGSPGALAIRPGGGTLYVVSNGAPSRIFRGPVAADGTVTGWTDVSDANFREAVNRVVELAVDKDGTVYAPMSGGMLVLDP